MDRRKLLAGVVGFFAVAGLSPKAKAAEEPLFDHMGNLLSQPKFTANGKPAKRRKFASAKQQHLAYKGRKTVMFFSGEKPGTIVIKTRERALYFVLGGGKAVRYGVAVGKEGFSWSGVARVGSKAVNPRWTPPAEMIVRTPRYAKWAGGMPGGIPENPLGVRAIYLFNKGGDTGFRIHGTNAPSSIGTAASSGCIRMLNHEVIELYGKVRIGSKVIVV